MLPVLLIFFKNFSYKSSVEDKILRCLRMGGRLIGSCSFYSKDPRELSIPILVDFANCQLKLSYQINLEGYILIAISINRSIMD